MKHIYLDKEIGEALGLTTSDIVYHFKKNHIKGAHLDNVGWICSKVEGIGWICSKVEGNRFIKAYKKRKDELKLKKQKTIFDYKEDIKNG